MNFPAKKLYFIPNPVNFKQDQVLMALRLIAQTLACIEGAE